MMDTKLSLYPFKNFSIPYFLSLFCLITSAQNVYALEGTFSYDVIEGSESTSPVKDQVVLGIKGEMLRIDYIIKKTGVKETSVVIDFKKKIARYSNRGIKTEIDIAKTFQHPKFLMPEEMTKTKNKKILLDMTVEEYEAFYFYDGLRLPLFSWYSSLRVSDDHRPVWHLFKVHPVISLFNFFIHPVTKQIGLEMTVTRLSGSKVTYRCTKINKAQLKDSYFAY